MWDLFAILPSQQQNKQATEIKAVRLFEWLFGYRIPVEQGWGTFSPVRATLMITALLAGRMRRQSKRSAIPWVFAERTEKCFVSQTPSDRRKWPLLLYLDPFETLSKCYFWLHSSHLWEKTEWWTVSVRWWVISDMSDMLKYVPHPPPTKIKSSYVVRLFIFWDCIAFCSFRLVIFPHFGMDRWPLRYISVVLKLKIVFCSSHRGPYEFDLRAGSGPRMVTFFRETACPDCQKCEFSLLY